MPSCPHSSVPVVDIILASSAHSQLLFQIQRFRGRIAVEERAASPHQLTWDRRHIQAIDYQSWHVVGTDMDGQVVACARLRRHRAEVSVDDLSAKGGPLAKCEEYRSLLENSLKSTIASAKSSGMGVCEVGGWAVDHQWRGSAVPTTSALLIFALARRLGHCIGIATATRKSKSASILRRLGCSSFVSEGIELPPYYDSRYRCVMELLRFDSNIYALRYAKLIARAEKQLDGISVVSPVTSASAALIIFTHASRSIRR
jgi:predicted GNAT family N-acyltransferase